MSIELQIIKLLEEELGENLPNFGVIAGQSVAEAYFRLNNIPIKTRIKDIDLFYYDGEKFGIKKGVADYIITVDTKHKILQTESSYGMISIVEGQKLTINKVEERGKLNLIITEEKQYNRGFRYIHHVLESFDLNCVQIGIDLETKKLYKTKNFDNFVNTKQIEIINFCSPVPTIARLLEKKALSSGVFANVDYEIQLVISKILFFEKDHRYIRQRGMCMSVDRFNSFSKDTREIICKYFSLEYKDVQATFNDDIFSLVEFNYKKNMVSKDTFNKVNILKKVFKKVYRINGIDYSLFTRSFFINLLKKDFHEKVINKIHLKDSRDNTKLLMLSYFKDDIFEEKIIDLQALNRHYIFALQMFKNFKAPEIASFIRKIEKSDNTHIIGMFETGELNDLYIIRKDMSEILKDVEEANKKISANFKFHLDPQLLANDDIQLKQITNRNELLKLGNEMKHCVGGYWLQVNNGHSIIIDIVKNYKTKERWTLELVAQKKYIDRKEKENNLKDKKNLKTMSYKVNQVYGRFNEEAPKYVRDLSKDLATKITDQLTEDWIKKIGKR